MWGLLGGLGGWATSLAGIFIARQDLGCSWVLGKGCPSSLPPHPFVAEWGSRSLLDRTKKGWAGGGGVGRSSVEWVHFLDWLSRIL